MYPAADPGSICARATSYRDGQPIEGLEECPSTALPVPLVGGLSVADLPPHRFAYSWGLLSPAVKRVTSSPGSRVEYGRTVVEPGEECVVFLALVLGDEVSDRRAAALDLWGEGDDLLGRVHLRVVRPGEIEHLGDF
jgi:hypothetical protein